MIRSSHGGIDKYFSFEIIYQCFGDFCCLHAHCGAGRDFCLSAIVLVVVFASMFRMVQLDLCISVIVSEYRAVSIFMLTKVKLFCYPEGGGRNSSIKLARIAQSTGLESHA